MFYVWEAYFVTHLPHLVHHIIEAWTALQPWAQTLLVGVQDEIIEDPDSEFGTDVDPKQGEGPRVINVGIPGPGAHVPMWKRAWRDKILPAVARFKPDIIFISAGFDAHRKDDINFRSVGSSCRAICCVCVFTLHQPSLCCLP